jgi:hypothetical protein
MFTFLHIIPGFHRGNNLGFPPNGLLYNLGCAFLNRMIYGPKPCQAKLHIHPKSKSIKGYKPLSRKDRRQLKQFDISKAFLHPPSNEPNLSIPNKKEETGVQSTIGKDGKMGDWSIREFGDWFHRNKAKVHREQLKRRGEIKLT